MWCLKANRSKRLKARLTQTDPAFLARTYLRLGELYEAKGDRAKSMDYYTKFIDLWKDADIELQPTVAEARRRLDKLRRAVGRP